MRLAIPMLLLSDALRMCTIIIARFIIRYRSREIGKIILYF
jgi:hypothetical protein